VKANVNTHSRCYNPCRALLLHPYGVAKHWGVACCPKHDADAVKAACPDPHPVQGDEGHIVDGEKLSAASEVSDPVRRR
jgi:hypothetical protein